MKIVHIIILFWCTKFQFQNEDNYEFMNELRVVGCLNPLNKISMDEIPSGWIIKFGG